MSKSFKSTKTAFALALISSALIACTTVTPYGPATGGQAGYETQKLEDGKYRVTFEGNASTERSVLENYVLYRAAEMTLEQGMDHFVIADQSVESESRYLSHIDTFGSPLFGRRGFFYGSGFAGSSTVRERKSYTAGIIFEMRDGDKPADEVAAYDARQIVTNLAPVIGVTVS